MSFSSTSSMPAAIFFAFATICCEQTCRLEPPTAIERELKVPCPACTCRVSPWMTSIFLNRNLQDVGCDLRQRGDVAMALAHRARIDGGAAAGIDRDPRALPTAAIKAAHGKPPRRRHAAHMGVGGDPDAAIDAAAPQRLALTAAHLIVEGGERLFEQAVIVSAVIDRAHAAIGAIRKIGALNEIPPPELDLVDVQMPCHRVDGAFRDIRLC